MRYKKYGSTFILRIDRGEEIVSTLKAFCTGQKIARERNVRDSYSCY